MAIGNVDGKNLESSYSVSVDYSRYSIDIVELFKNNPQISVDHLWKYTDVCKVILDNPEISVDLS